MKVIYPYIKGTKKKLEERGEVCSIEYSNYAYDLICDGRYYKVKRVRSDGAVVITYAEYLDMRNLYPNLSLLIVDDKGNILYTMSIRDAVKHFYNLLTPIYLNIDGKPVKLKIVFVGGKKGVAVPVILSKQDWEVLKKKMVYSFNPLEELRRKLLE